ncbi:MFS transporter [Natrialbaceae archaeon A-gly3]
MDPNDRSITVFTSLAHAIFHTYELSIPLFVVFWLTEFDVSAALLGTVLAVGYGLIGLLAPISGVLADVHGSRRLITLSILAMAAGFFVLALATNVYTLAAAVVVWGTGASLYHPAGLSLISRNAERRGTVLAIHGAGGNVGTAAGPILTATLLIALEWRLVVLCLLVPAVVAVALGFRIDFEEADGRRKDGGRRDGGIGPLAERMYVDSIALLSVGFLVAFAAILTYGVYYRGLLTFLPEIIRDLGVVEVRPVGGLDVDAAQYVYAALLTVGIAGQYAGGKLTERIRSEYAMLATLAALGVLAAAFFPSVNVGLPAFLLVCVLIGFFLYATAPIYQAVIADYSAETLHGLSYGYAYLGMFGIGAAGASIAGVLLTYAGSMSLFLALSAAAFLGCLIVISLIVS